MFSSDEVLLALGPGLRSHRRGLAGGFSAVTNDSRVARPGELFVALKTEMRDGHDFIPDAVSRGVAGIVAQHEPPHLPAGVWLFTVEDSWHAIGDLALAYRNRFPVRATVVTGNVGKTTTKELTASILGRRYNVLRSPANFNDEVGLAMTLFGLQPSHERAVLEVGMFRLGEIRRLCEIARPSVAVVMNVGPTHVERLGSIETVARAKAEAVESLDEDGWAVLNADDAWVAAMAERTRARVLSFGLHSDATVRASHVRSFGLKGTQFTLSCGGRSVAAHCPLPGAALVANALAATGVALAEGMSLEEAAGALAMAEPAARLQARRAACGALVLDDSYNASPASMLAALSVLAETPGRRLALLGDMLELGSEAEGGHAAVGRRAADIVERLYTIGELGDLIRRAALDAGLRQVHHFSGKDEAVAELRKELRPGDVLLVKASHGLDLGAVVRELAP